MSSTFASFHLTIAAPHGDRYPVTARTQAGNEVNEDILLPLDDPTLTVYQMALRYPISIDESVVIAVGQLLYQALFQGTIAEAFATARAHADQQKVALRLHLAIQKSLPTIAALPWELMATEAGRPLMLEHALVRTFSWNDPIPDLGIPSGERIRLAVTSALPMELADHPIAAEDEVAIIRAAITHSARPIDLIEVPHLTRDRLTDLLTNQRPHIVHHIGHGIIQSDMSYLDLERADQSRDQLSAREFSSMLHQSGVQLVVLNACHTGSAGENLLTSFAPIFITDRIPAAIGMQAAILNRTGHCFANAFYAALGNSGSIDASLIAARKAILADGHEHGAWGFPTLYSRVPHSQLWGYRTPQPVDPLTQRDRERITKAAQQIESDRLLNLRLQGFVGRVNELAAMREHIEAMRPTGGYVLIKAAAGEGKSSSIAKLIQEAGIAQTPHHFIALTTGRDYQLGLLRAVVAQLILKHNLTVSYFPEESYPAMKGEFARILDDLSKQGIQETIYLDGLDQLQPERDGSRDLSFLPPQPPPGIVIVLGSRPDETLKPLEILHRVDYALPPLSEGDALALWRSVQPAVADSLLHDLYTALKGNALFVYLAADTMRDQSVVDATSLIRRIEQNPHNLFGITLERIKNRSEHRWPTIWKPMLALLLVAQEPLRLDVLGDLLEHDHDTMQDAVWVLGGLVSQGIDQRVALHHLLFRDFLAASVFNDREVKRWHQRLADWCAQDVDAIWADHPDTMEQARRIYARYHYIIHLALAENWTTLWQVLDTGDYGEQKTRFDPSTRLYALDLDRGRESAITAGRSTEEHIQNLPRLWKYSLLRTSLTSRVDQWPDEVFEVLAIVGRTHEALERIELLSSNENQISCWLRILPWCDNKQQHLLVMRLDEVCRHLSGFDKKMDAIRAIANAAATHGQREQALAILTTAVSIAHSIDHPYYRSDALATIAKDTATYGQREQALAILTTAASIAHSIDDPSDKSAALATIAIAAATLGQREQALAILTTAVSIAHSIDDPYEKSDALATIAIAAATLGQREQALAILATAVSIAHSIDHPYYRSDALATIAKDTATYGAIDQALSIAHSIDNPYYRSDALATIANAAATHGQREQALAILTTAVSIAQSIDGFNKSAVLATFANAAATYGAIDQALSIAHSIDGLNRSDALATVAKGIATYGAIDQALSIAHSIDHPYYRSDALATIANAAATHGQREQALAILTTAVSIAQSIDGFNKSAVLATFAKDTATYGAIDQALSIAHSIDHPLQRRDVLLIIAATAATHGQQEQALAILATAVSIAHSIDDPSHKSAVLETIAKDTATYGAIDHAVSITQSIDSPYHKSKALASIANAAATLGQREQALAILTTAVSIAHSIDHSYHKSAVLATFANAAATYGAIDQALSIAHSIDGLINRSDALATVAKGTATYGAIDQALSIAHSIDHPLQRRDVLLIIAATAATHGQREQALAILATAVSIAHSIDIPWQKSDALATIAKDTATYGAIDHAVSITHSIDDLFYKSDALFIIAATAATLGQQEQALAILATAVSIAQSIDSLYYLSDALATIVNAAATHGQREQALAIAHSIDDPSHKSAVLATIAIAAATHGQREQALAIAHSIDDPYHKSDALTTIANAAVTHGQREQALAILTTAASIAHSIDDPYYKSGALATIANAAATLGQREQALAILATAASITQSIDDPYEKSDALATIANAAATLGQREQALAILATAVSITHSIDSPSHKSTVLATIVNAATHSAIDHAVSITQSIDSPYHKSKALASIANAAATLGQREQALAILTTAVSITHSIDSPSHKSTVLATIANAAATYGAIDQALSIAHSIDDPLQRHAVLATIAAADASQDAIERALSIAHSIDNLDHRAETFRIILQKDLSVIDVLTSIQHEWFRSKIPQDLWTMTPMIAPLLNDYPWLGTVILEEEAWVNEQLKRLG
ncbi:TPR repeat-containing protein (plasmid) [Herpetosiphon aurantiacus DSM 785]|uniref:TPR repeat-containing protein n=1 Tax=Herpetosiphon aurantiacus (strain ATCC 23779 / DSM 785 / 114-95) TaxID=316274 RepID=A9B981_HERA2|nr:TPR repeat-containing protein [Herpetosiphon aurantiacus DSM 785]